MERTVNLDLPTLWSCVRDVRAAVDTALVGKSDDVRRAAMMVASELVENAIKYGRSVPTLEGARFRLCCTDDKIRIEVSNGLTTATAAHAVQATIAALAAADDREALYVERLQALLDDPEARGGLGLHRACTEGRFELAAKHEGDILTITATREMA